MKLDGDQGKTFVFTKFRDAGIQTQIENQGGKISNSVTKNTTAVVTLDVRNTSTKATKAKQLGVPIISLNQLRTIYLS
jgi:NAD-dependent DNA ligase